MKNKSMLAALALRAGPALPKRLLKSDFIRCSRPTRIIVYVQYAW
jgi:hypothetical protein